MVASSDQSHRNSPFTAKAGQVAVSWRPIKYSPGSHPSVCGQDIVRACFGGDIRTPSEPLGSRGLSDAPLDLQIATGIYSAWASLLPMSDRSPPLRDVLQGTCHYGPSDSPCPFSSRKPGMDVTWDDFAAPDRSEERRVGKGWVGR